MSGASSPASSRRPIGRAGRPADLAAVRRSRLLDIVGADRLLFGSDWPVCLLAASYDVVLATARTLIAALTSNEQAAILGATAIAVYRLGVDPSRPAQ